MKSAILYGPLYGLMTLGLCTASLAQPSQEYPKYQVGPQANGTYVMSTGQIVSPAGRTIILGSPVRTKAVALNSIVSQVIPTEVEHGLTILRIRLVDPSTKMVSTIVIDESHTGSELMSASGGVLQSVSDTGAACPQQSVYEYGGLAGQESENPG